ncbi:MAG: DUF3187 family protein [Candidatus Thiodiazotropha lotti]|nr:DUF3187 family protein [Candidatus Thiodiazotropha lotti]MCW4194571.1 DUF3187 family protein [Candidatus Thiodiazotropha lotti]MCW4201251.1 DUF3187 family protein [Candidatus Thiodiazotropha lotti]MCW4204223.1 DUF3187 family protein [Candidatus Thiodiazotropha lotti]MCW4208499.1 DUF3187 family protein [Candidatus Thiodiazotropha lotti]
MVKTNRFCQSWEENSLLLIIFRSILLLCSTMTGVAQASQPEPFHVRNMNPFTLLHGLPVATPSELLGDQQNSLSLQLDVANTSMETVEESEQVTLDGETYRLALTWQRGIGSGWQVGVEVPYLSHRGGGLDSLIENWHDLFGFSNSDRDDWQQNQLRYLYIRDGVTEVDIQEKVSGIGDIQFHLSRELSLADEEMRASVHMGLKLPSGDEESLLGSGAPDLSIWLTGSDRKLLPGWPFGGYGHMGVLLMGKAEVLEEDQREFVLFGTLGINWRVYQWLDLKAQVDAHTPFYHSSSDQLGGSAVMLTFGGTIPLEGGDHIDLSLGENMTTDMVPDLIFNIRYEARF